MFQVVWLQSALDELATLWMGANSATRQQITSAANAVDQALQANPMETGESRDGEERVFFIQPLGIQFEIDEARSLIRVLHIWDIRRKK